MHKNKKDKLFRNTGFYVLLGAVSAILLARLYVYLGGNLSLGYDGITFHHIFLGIIIVLVSGMVFFSFNDYIHKNRKFMNILGFIFGFGAGLITDEANFLISIGHYYNLSNYYKPINLYVDLAFIILIGLLFVYSFFREN